MSMTTSWILFCGLCVTVFWVDCLCSFSWQSALMPPLCLPTLIWCCHTATSWLSSLPTQIPGISCWTGLFVGWLVANIPAAHHCNNNRIQRCYSRFCTISSQRRELSPTRTLKWPGRNRVQIMCNTSSAYHVQVSCYVPYGTKGQLSYYVWQS